MAFHSRSSRGRAPRGRDRKEIESILGLSGWLFADLLLAIAIIFLVIQSRPGTDNVDLLKSELASMQKVNQELENQLNEISKSLKDGVKGGLLADPSEQLLITIPGGTKISSASAFMQALNRSTVTKGRDKTTLDAIQRQHLRVGFVLWFTPTSERSKSTSNRNLRYLISALKNLDLVTEEQLSDPNDTGVFPCLCDYNDTTVRGSDLKLRIFLYPLLGKK